MAKQKAAEQQAGSKVIIARSSRPQINPAMQHAALL